MLAAILGVSGVVDLYLINRAVYWWRSIHPAVIVQREGGSGLGDPLMRVTLIVTMLAFFLLFLWLLRLRVRTAQLQESVDEVRERLATELRIQEPGGGGDAIRARRLRCDGFVSLRRLRGRLGGCAALRHRLGAPQSQPRARAERAAPAALREATNDAAQRSDPDRRRVAASPP